MLILKLIGEVIFKVNLLKSEKINVKAYVNQRKSLADLKPSATVVISFVFSS